MSEDNNPISTKSEALPAPTELSGASLNSSLPAAQPTTSEKESPRTTSLPSIRDQGHRFEFLSFVHDYVWANLQFAEQKAGLVFAADTAFLGYVVSTIPSNFAKLILAEQCLFLATIVVLITSIGLIVSVVIPRLGGDRKGLIYFGAISHRVEGADYTEEVLRATQPEVDSAVATHIYEIARITTRKQILVRWAVLTGLVGFLLGLFWLATQHVISSSPSDILV